MPRPDILLIPVTFSKGCCNTAWRLWQFGLRAAIPHKKQPESHPNRVAASDFLAAILALVSHIPRLSDRFSLYTVSCESM
jgi:hypothetical protein